MTATFYVGDAIQVMNSLPESSVDLVLSSPPFLALRSYLPADHPDKALEGGSQSTPGEFIDWLLDVVDACARVLAPHGSLVFELGDTYAGSGGAGGDYLNAGLRDGQPAFDGSATRGRTQDREYDGGASDRWDFAKPGTNSRLASGTGWPVAKSLSLIPESFRWAMVYGRNPFTGRECATWRLRNVIRWVRPNPPVGALGDKFRPATSELMVFCKAKDRFFDLDAVREPFKYEGNGGGSGSHTRAGITGEGRFPGPLNTQSGAPPLDWWNIPPGGYPGSHYAVWPPELLIKPVKAMCPSRVCRVCGEPSRRITEADAAYRQTTYLGRGFHDHSEDALVGRTQKRDNGHVTAVYNTIGFSDCGHQCKQCEGIGSFQEQYEGSTFTRTCRACDGVSNWRPGVVLDPFGGSGTTALVATGHGRDCILIDLDSRNFDLALERVGPFILTLAETPTG